MTNKDSGYAENACGNCEIGIFAIYMYKLIYPINTCEMSICPINPKNNIFFSSVKKIPRFIGGFNFIMDNHKGWYKLM